MAACHKQHAEGFSVIVTSLLHYIKCWLLNSNTHSNTDCGFMDVYDDDDDDDGPRRLRDHDDIMVA